MILNKKKTTRREFLKQSANVAGAAMISGLTFPSVASSFSDVKAAKELTSAPRGRHDYQIFSQGMIGKMPVKNRLVRSATMINAASNGETTNVYIDIHRELAKGGVGLIISGFMLPTKDDAINPSQIHIYDDRHIQSIKRVADAVHKADKDCKFFAQVGHSGTKVSPSGIPWPLSWKRNKVRALTTDEVEKIVTDHAKAVWRVKKAGFDGVELHGAHNYLLASFLSPFTNRRDDKYGGTLEKRVRIIKDIMVQSRALVGDDFPITIKLNSEERVKRGIVPETFDALAKAIVKTGVDAIDVSGSNCIQENIDSTEDETYFFKGAKAANITVPIIVTGGNRTIDHMEKILNTKEVAFFGLARPLIREPDLPNRWLEGRGAITADCISCNECFWAIFGGKTASCTQV